MNTKMVIVVRGDLKDTNGQKIRTGKLAAQVGHASSDWLLAKLAIGEGPHVGSFLEAAFSAEEVDWMNNGLHRKVCVKVPNETALLAVYEKAKAAGLNAHLVIDLGLTQFGEPTKTCVGIGPHIEEKFVGVTDQLELL